MRVRACVCVCVCACVCVVEKRLTGAGGRGGLIILIFFNVHFKWTFFKCILIIDGCVF